MALALSFNLLKAQISLEARGGIKVVTALTSAEGFLQKGLFFQEMICSTFKFHTDNNWPGLDVCVLLTRGPSSISIYDPRVARGWPPRPALAPSHARPVKSRIHHQIVVTSGAPSSTPVGVISLAPHRPCCAIFTSPP